MGSHLTYVQCMMQDSRGYYWFCGARGIVCSDGTTYVRLSAENGLLYRNYISTILGDNAANLQFGTKDGVVIRFQPAAGSVATPLIPFHLLNNSAEGYVPSSHLDYKGY